MKVKLLILAAFTAILVGSVPARVFADFNKNLVISDSVFNNESTMSSGDIQAFLNQFPNSCLKNYEAAYPIGYNSYGDKVPAAKVIKRAAQIYDMNPQVILATLQKESSLVTGNDGCASWRYQSAMGMGCPDGGECPAPGYEGFSRQVTKGSWLLKFGKERSRGNVNWEADDGVGGDFNISYGGPMTKGCHKRNIGSPVVCYDGYTTIDNQSVFITTGATGSFYNYTPHFHGNELFVAIFENWFGSTVADTGKDIYFVGDWDGDGNDTPAVKRGNTFYFDNNNDGLEDETYSWGKPTDKVIVGDWDGDGADEIGLKRGREYFFDYENNASSNVYFSWGKPTDTVIIGDWNGNGEDTIGLKRGNEYFFDFDNDASSDVYYAWGRDTDKVIVGDWNNNNINGIGLKRESYYFLDYDNNASSNVSYVYTY